MFASLTGRADLPRLSLSARFGIALIVAFALWLRLWNNGAGVPYDVHQDEPQIANRVVSILQSGDFNPRFFDWPSLSIYLHTAVGALVFMGGSMRGYWHDLSQFSPDDYFLAGRTVTAFLGAGTVLVVFLAARRFSVITGLVAAALLAGLPGHVRESHLMLADVPAGFFAALALLLSMRAWEQPSWGRLIAAASAVGFAASAKYNACFTVVFPLIAAWAGHRSAPEIFRRSLLVCGVAAGAFLITTPYAILNLPGFLNDYARVSFNFARERPGEPGWSLYLKYLSGNLSWPAFSMLVLGVAVAARRLWTGPHRAYVLMLLLFLPLYFWVMARSFQIYGRYLVPVYPIACVLVGLAVGAVWSRVRTATAFPGPLRALAALLLAGVVLPPAIGAIGNTRDLDRPSTSRQVHEWFLANTPAGARVLVEDGVVRLPARYPVRHVGSLISPKFDPTWIDEADYLIAGGRTWDLVFSDPGRDPEQTVQYRRILGRGDEVAAFDPSDTVGGPRVRIYRIKR